MKTRRISLLLMLCTSMVFAQHTPRVNENEFKPGELWYDTQGTPINAHGGGMLFHQGVYYWFGEFKVAGEVGNLAQVGVSCYSSKDLYHWTNEGIALPVSTDENSDIAKG